MSQPRPAQPRSSPPAAPLESQGAIAAALPLLIACILFILTLVLLVRGGLTIDMRQVAPGLESQVPLIVTARYAGILEIILTSIPSLLAVFLGGWGAGQWVSRPLAPHAGQLIHTTTGLGALWLLFEFAGLAGFANSSAAWLLCALAAAAGALAHRTHLRRLINSGQSITVLPRLRHHWAALLVAPPAAALVVAACCPPGTLWAVEAWGYDVLSYHLQIPRQWLAAGRITGLEHNVYSYLPSLVEVAFLQLGAMRNSMYDATYTCQLLSVSLMALAAANLGCTVQRLLQRFAPSTPFATPAAWLTAAIFLATPWTLITGSMAYDEAAVMAFAAAALAVVLQHAAPPPDSLHHSSSSSPHNSDAPAATPTAAAPPSASHASLWQSALLTGLLAGLATHAKLTAGFMVAVPLGLAWLVILLPITRKTARHTFRQVTLAAAVMALTGTLVLCPYFIRNAAWTGNPVFPFATATLGQGHWDDALADRWNRGHHVTESLPQRITALGQHWLFNTGYAAVAGRDRLTNPDAPEARNVAYFPRQWGVPTLLLAALAAAVVLLLQHAHRRLAIALLAILLTQIFAWLFFTHLQSRFMVFSLLPVCLLVGYGLAVSCHHWLRHLPVVFYAAAVLLVAVPMLISAHLLKHQTAGGTPLWMELNTLPPASQLLTFTTDQRGPSPADHPINLLPPHSRTLLIADNARLFYIQRPILYHSAFDQSPLGDIIRRHPNDPAAVTRALRSQGVTHVWLHLPELHRLMTTYGHDPDVNPATLHQLIQTGWQPVPYPGQHPAIALYKLPD